VPQKTDFLWDPILSEFPRWGMGTRASPEHVAKFFRPTPRWSTPVVLNNRRTRQYGGVLRVEPISAKSMNRVSDHTLTGRRRAGSSPVEAAPSALYSPRRLLHVDGDF